MNLSEVNKLQKKLKRERWEAEFIFQVEQYHFPAPERQFKFHDLRRWRFDFAWPALKLAVEIDGLLPGKGGRHQRYMGYEEDCIKLAEANALGWIVLRFTPSMVKDGIAVSYFSRCYRNLLKQQKEAQHAESHSN